VRIGEWCVVCADRRVVCGVCGKESGVWYVRIGEWCVVCAERNRGVSHRLEPSLP